jgi:hypothetical protein
MAIDIGNRSHYWRRESGLQKTGNTNWRGHDDVMQIRSFRGSGEPVWVSALPSAGVRLGSDPRRALGPAAAPAASTGRTRDRTRPILQLRQKVLARAPSTRDPKRTFGNFRAAAWPERRAKRFRLGSLHQQHAWTIQSVGTSDQCLLNVNLQARTPCRLPAPVVGSNLAMTRNEIRVWGGAKPIL